MKSSLYGRIPGYVALAFIFMLLFSTQLVQAEEQKTAALRGTVRDENNEPISSVSIRVLGPGNARVQSTTDSSGEFRAVVDREGWYSVYAMYNRSDTPGVDYVPSLWRSYLQLGSTATFTFTLEKGASLYVDEELWFVESREPVDRATFTVAYPNGEQLSGKSSIYTYGSDSDLVSVFDFDPRLVVVPADKEVIIDVSSRIGRSGVSHSFTMKGKTGYFKISQGATLHVDVRDHSLAFNVASLKDMLNSALSLLKDAVYAGFLVTVERQDLQDASGLIDSSLSSINKGLYDESFAKLRNAYILTSRTRDGLQVLLHMSSQSALILSLLFVFIASAGAYLITERQSSVDMLVRGRKKFSFSLNSTVAMILYAVLFSSFHFAYPGCRLVPPVVLIPVSLFALIAGQLVVAASPGAFSERKGEQRSIQFRSAVMAAFSMACRNLRRRRLRTALTLANIVILIFAFITFTSISPGYGLITQPLRPAIAVDALLIRDIPVDYSLYSPPLPTSFVTWLEHQPNVTFVSPKAENIPVGLTDPIGYLRTESGEKLHVQGVVGVMPNVEAEFTGIKEIVVFGDSLQSNDHDGIVVSSTLREKLNIGDSLYGFEREFVIKGFFDLSALEKLVDVDGQLFIPNLRNQMGAIVPCTGDQVIIVTYDTALTLPRTYISRVDVHLESPNRAEYFDFAQMVTLSRGYQVYVSHPGSLHLQYLGTQVEEKGASMIPFLMLLVILHISASMFSVVNERTDEIASLSSVGLNPTHIAVLLVAEASIVGFVGGGLGYLLGIFGYRLASVSFFGTLFVREKASVEWGLLALVVSGLTAILASAIPAFRASTIVTPSLLRRWSVDMEGKPREAGQPWVLDIPIKLMPRELDPFTGFIVERLRERSGSRADYVTDIELEEQVTDDDTLRSLGFVHFAEEALRIRNKLVIRRGEAEHLDVKLLCFPSGKSVKAVPKTGTFVRKIVLEWNAKKFEVAAPFDPSLSTLYTLVNAYSPTSLYVITQEAEVMRKLEPLSKVLVAEGIRPPRIVISRVNALEIEECMKAAKEVVSRADVVCISGGSSTLCTLLAINATIQGKTKCVVIDPRPIEVRRKDPLGTLKVVNI